MSLIDHYFRKVPDYYPTMYQDGFTEAEIWHAFHKKMRQDEEARRVAAMERRLAELERMLEEKDDCLDLSIHVK